MNERERLKKEIKEGIGDGINDMLTPIKILQVVLDAEHPGAGDLVIDVLVEELNKLRRKTPEGDESQKVKKAMLSQPMGGKTDAEIVATRERAVAALEAMGYEVVNTLFTDEWYSPESMKERGVVQVPLCFLAKSLESMSLCHTAYFCKGWEHARGCKIEHEAAVAYGLDIIYEE